MNRLIRKKHERIQKSVQRYEESHGYRKPESVEDNDNIISTTKRMRNLMDCLTGSFFCRYMTWLQHSRSRSTGS